MEKSIRLSLTIIIVDLFTQDIIINYIIVRQTLRNKIINYKLYNGKTYTGKYPGDGPNEEIILSTLGSPSLPNVTSPTTTNVPPLYPTPKDYEVGVFTRYFIKKRNEFLFDELTKDQYNNVNITLYIKFQIQWQLVGDKDATYITNRNMVLVAEQKSNVYGLQSYLKEDYFKYYK